MRTNVVFTFIGEDKPGLVESISRIIKDHQGNWLESRLSQLAGKFAGIIQVGLDVDQIDGLIDSLQGHQGLTVVVKRGSEARGDNSQAHTLMLLGLDRPGIVADVSSALAGQNINVLEFNTNIVKAAMTGEPMFEAKAEVEYAKDTDVIRLAEDLEIISAALGVDIELED
jgi:glycine cleavage system regulatory protein